MGLYYPEETSGKSLSGLWYGAAFLLLDWRIVGRGMYGVGVMCGCGVWGVG